MVSSFDSMADRNAVGIVAALSPMCLLQWFDGPWPTLDNDERIQMPRQGRGVRRRPRSASGRRIVIVGEAPRQT
jgi:hypothetical protein